MTRDELFARLATLRRANVGPVRAPHKPLLLLWLFGRYATSGTTRATFAEANEAVSELINDFGPGAKAATTRHRAAMPFVHLERELWDLRDADGRNIGTDTQERPTVLKALGAVGQLSPEVEQLLADPLTLAAAARQLLDRHFTPSLAQLIADRVGLDLAALEVDSAERPLPGRRIRDPRFAAAVMEAYAYTCAMCGFDGRHGRHPVGLEAAHVRWHSQGGADQVVNGLALCVLHHTLFDLGMLGLTTERIIRVSPRFVTATASGRRAVDDLDGQELAVPRPHRLTVEQPHIDWHTHQVFKT